MSKIILFMLFWLPITSPADCTAPWGESIAEGSAVNAFFLSWPSLGETCQMESRQCLGGILTGSFLNQFCNANLGCQGPFGLVPNGGVVWAYEKPNANAGESCRSEARNCFNGSLSGSYIYPGCSEMP